jgi:hypothetical protein
VKKQFLATLGLLGAAVLTGCAKDDIKTCTDKTGKVWGDDKCQQEEQRRLAGYPGPYFYWWLYNANFYSGSHYCYGGYRTPMVGHTYDSYSHFTAAQAARSVGSYSRGGFGSSFHSSGGGA